MPATTMLRFSLPMNDGGSQWTREVFRCLEDLVKHAEQMETKLEDALEEVAARDEDLTMLVNRADELEGTVRELEARIDSLEHTAEGEG
jgi:polyhydroxyalkanoate synthesis regulator phasin